MSGIHSADDSGECQSVLHDVWLYLDNELDERRRAAVQRHLDDCSPCLEEAGLDEKLKRLLQTKCGGDRAPERLRERVVAQLFQVTGRVSGTGAVIGTVSATSISVEWERAPGDASGVGGAGCEGRSESDGLGGDGGDRVGGTVGAPAEDDEDAEGPTS